MSFYTMNKGPEYSVCDALQGAVHCFSTRLGGVSKDHLSSLNLGMHRGDEKENVVENYRILGDAVGFSPEQTVFTKQQHTDIIRVVTKENCGEGLFRDTTEVCDGHITDCPDVALVTFSADCTPVLLFDPVRRAIGAVHAGWRGTAQGIAAKAVDAMVREFGCERQNIRAAIGPCIGKCCFETDWDVPQAMLDALGPKAVTAFSQKGEKYHVDLKFCNALWLQRAGVGALDISPDCTACCTDRYWSHRKQGDLRGSLAGIIMLK
ncbi:MAG: peptidoglycan editing factor PgeF [Oscillospiraceae bacterium]|nr:peptidoglycan editing factor PgeF [Oscillospiraceae bacterium]